MRLDDAQRDAIRGEVRAAFGPVAVVRLFGSRCFDAAKGGDVDLLVEVPEPVPDPAWRTAWLEARLMRRLGGRRVDVLLAAPNLDEQPIHALARDQGLRL
ncbi:nucleotidyltransferase domain-containing protein [Silanimonas lenta]|jgi:predicted nucleotidyltransferase|uniref:nucleotidyltransferase domain-containing protein n=1 Tax=Silanimonas lenta TaxID=265429 RepID=UPI00048B967A|nr:nucleotidyltransferase domain-containing protein [Silanimonas lenta]